MGTEGLWLSTVCLNMDAHRKLKHKICALVRGQLLCLLPECVVDAGVGNGHSHCTCPEKSCRAESNDFWNISISHAEHLRFK